MLERIQRGPQRRPLAVCVYGVPGVGKTTFGASAPGALVWCLEDGASFIDVAKLPAPESWNEALGVLQELADKPHDFKTLVVDTLDALEVLAVAHVCAEAKKKTLADFAWGGGYAALANEWRRFLSGLDNLRAKRAMHIVLIAHEHRKRHDDPELGQYEMYRPKLQEKAWGLTNEWCDAVLFAQFDAAVFEKEGQKNRAIVSGRRVLRTVRETGFVAKNRLGLPRKVDLDWKSFEAAAVPPSTDVLRKELVELCTLAGEDVATKAHGFLADRGESVETLRAAIETVKTYLAEKSAA
ncbi:ATP-binding protein [Brasilonema bromeliae]|nr:ATP-binding protein [Brasilonema bromeliae]